MMKWFAYLGLVLTTLLTACKAPPAQEQPRALEIDPVMPADKLDRALNGTFNFPPSPAVAWTPDARGFAQDRLFHVPPPGQHPRILFAEEDLPRLRQSLSANEAGKIGLAALRAQLAKGLDHPETWESQCFQALAAGNLEAFKQAYKENALDDVPPGSGFKGNVPGRHPATKWGVRNPLLMCLEIKSLLALLDNDPVAGKQVATAFATYAAWISPKIDAANLKPRHEFHWYSTRDLVPNEIAYGYDWSWKWMTPEQRETVHSVILRATVGKYTLGMDLPAHWRNWNHLGMTESYAACLFALEGEPGEDPRQLQRLYEVYRDYLSYSIDDLGTGTEGIGYQTIGIGHISAPLIAYANRGKNLFLHPHWRRHAESWLVQAMQPFGGAWQSCSDLGDFPPNPALVQVQKYFYPQSPGIDFVYRNIPMVMKKDWGAMAVGGLEPQWILPVMPDTQETRETAQQQAAALVGGGLTFYDRVRGFLYTRTGWGRDDLTLHVDAKCDSTFANHDHSDRGQFTLAALGRAWACDGYRDTESKYHNVVTIDGRGQGFFATPPTWLAETDDARSTTAVVDTKYCWDWQWMKSSFLETNASRAKRDLSNFDEAAQRLQARIPVSQWEPDPTVSAYYQGFADRAHGDPRMWDDEDGWVVRSKWYPVQKAFRTVILNRGQHPYVLIADDLRKDDAEHLYEWRMNMPPDIATVSIDGSDIVLGDATTQRQPTELSYAFQGKTGLVPQKGNRLLLVRTLEMAQPELPTLQPIPMVAAVEYKKTDDSHQFSGRSMGMGTQVVIGSRSVEPRFLVLLYPHREGDEVPVTTWNDDKSRLTVAWPHETQIYDVQENPQGRRIFTLEP